METKELYKILNDNADEHMQGRKTFMILSLFEGNGQSGCSAHIVDDKVVVPCTNKDLTVIQAAAFEAVQDILDVLKKQLVKTSLLHSLRKDPKDHLPPPTKH